MHTAPEAHSWIDSREPEVILEVLWNVSFLIPAGDSTADREQVPVGAASNQAARIGKTSVPAEQAPMGV